MTETCRLLDCGVCRHEVIGPAIVHPEDCAACIAFDGRESEELNQLRLYREGLREHVLPQSTCMYLGTKLSVAACCGQMYACNLFKGKKCAVTGIAKQPFLSCQACAEYKSSTPIETKIRSECTAVTSINPDPSRKDRQLKCLESWLNVGLRVIVVNTSSELDAMPWLNGIAEQSVNNQTAEGYDRPVQKVHSVIRAGMLTGGSFIVINSDIQIDGDVAPLSAAIEMRDRLTIGVRYNQSGKSLRPAILEPAGLDVFVMTPEMGSTVVDIGFGIGKPGWDYWVPVHFRERGIKFNWIQTPLFFHEPHPVGWSDADWMKGHDMIKAKFGVSIASAGFREGFSKW